MQALILAAGRGSRLGGEIGGRPKCLLEVGGRPLIEHQLEALREAGVRRICVVVGYGAEQVLPVVANAGVCQFNYRYAQTNSLYSMWLTRDWIKGPMVMMNCDLMVAPEIIGRVAGAEGNVLAFDSSSGFDGEQMRTSFCSGGVLRDISKRLGPDESDGENVGILKFDSAASAMLFQEASRIVARGGENEWAPAAVGRLAERVEIRGLDVAGLPWTEIDFPEDLDHARERVWPSIRGRSRGVRGDIDESSGLALPS